MPNDPEQEPGESDASTPQSPETAREGEESGSPASLWRHRDFVNLWTAATVSNFGSMVRRVAVPFVAILVLDAGAKELALLTLADTVPGFLLGLWAGDISDRRSRRPILIFCDWGRAALLLTIPLAAGLGVLRIELLYIVVFASATLSAMFSVARRSYLPTLVERSRLVEANAKLSAGASAAEATAFPVAGWLVQWLGAPLAILVDATSYMISALTLSRIRTAEPAPEERQHSNRLRSIARGFETVVRDPLLRVLTLSAALRSLSFAILSVVYLLFASRELGFATGVLGMVFAVGSVSSLLGALAAERLGSVIGVGPSIVAGTLCGALAIMLLPLTPATFVLGLTVLALHQLLGDGGETIANVGIASLIQAAAPPDQLGRVNGCFTFTFYAAQLIGAALAGWLGEVFGLRNLLALAGLASLASALLLAASPVRRVRDLGEANLR